MARTVVLHYHLFKNAGTSVEHLLKASFPGRCRTREFPSKGRDNSALVAGWIKTTPRAVAYSSHTMLGPLPQIDGVDIVSLLLLRDPIARIVSAYKFEQKQTADTWGAELAKSHDFEGYVRARLARDGDKQCRNFQANRLAMMRPGKGSYLERAVAALDAITVVGFVEEFEATMADLEVACRARGLNFKGRSVRRNAGPKEAPIEISPELEKELERANRADRALIAYLTARRRAVAAV